MLDRSGSMHGWKMAAARRAAARIVDTLTPADRFTVLAFDNSVETPPELPPGLVDATDRNKFRTVRHLSTLESRGGTDMLPALQLATTALSEDESRERVLVLVTDGQVGNEDQILQSLGSIRVHTIGIDTAVNAAFLRRLATVTGGRCELVESEDRLDEAMRHIHHRIGTPLVTDLAVRSAGLQVDEDSLTPARLPDLFAGAPVVISGRYTGDGDGAVLVEGRDWRTTVSAVPSDNDSLPASWARARIRDLEDRYVIQDSGQAELEREIVDVSLRFHVLSRFTAFVAVDPRVVNESGQLHQVLQPVELPHGWAAGGFGAAPAGFAAPGGFAVAGGFAPPPAPAMAAAPMMAKRSRRSAPEAPLPSTVARYLTVVLKQLGRLATRPEAERLAHLATLAEDIERRLDGFRAAGLSETAVRKLRALAAELAQPTDLDDLWQRAVEVLEALAGQRPSFWKR
ncbi:VWA domain-containing protein [Kutzneria chonburiensis]|uniref:VWA domain-containing protein n=1 Tax=Kutzneria chonburiensis TaxID=1483604 RepID=UPI00235FA1AD|nr:VWA domain-containing protein [Kutzneria chonburiensis]